MTQRPPVTPIVVMTLALVLLKTAAALADFTVDKVDTRFQNDMLVMDAHIDYAFSKVALKALDNGVPLTLDVHVQLRRSDAWMWEESLVDEHLRYVIRYKPLSERYTVTRLPGDDGRSYVTRDAAITALGTIEGLQLVPKARLDAGRTYLIELRAALDVEELPLPLRPMAYLLSLLEALDRLDRMAPETLKRLRHPGAIPVGALLVVLFVALNLMSEAVQNSQELSRAFVPLLFTVLVGLTALAILVAVNVTKLVRRYREQAAGSRLTGRIVVLFALISVLPVGVVYYYSLGFLLRGIDSWFDVEIDRAMEDALALNQASLDLNQRVLMKYAEQLIAGIEDRSTTALALSLGTLRRRAGALELTVFGPAGQVYGTANEDPTQLVPDLPGPGDHAPRAHGRELRGARRPAQAGTWWCGCWSADPSGRPLELQAIFPTSARISELSARLENAYNRYKELAYLRESLKLSFSLTLSLVLLFSLMAALIAAFHTARRLVAPVADIARGTRAIAEGDYEQQLPLPSHDDELAFLVASFNAMTRRIAQARDAAARSQQAVETQRTYLETVLGRLSSGVVVLDAWGHLRTANPAASHILRLKAEPADDQTLESLEQNHPRLARWADTVREHLAAGQEWRAEVTLFGGEGTQILMCRGSPLVQPGTEGAGHVVVFDDITNLIMAQRDAAWGEVARRLAHEIKNPLTPIQLSAERLRHKLLSKLPEQDARVVDRATHTIVQQVEAMKAMVNDFSNYARSPKLEAEPLRLDALVTEVLDLYRSAKGERAIQAHLNGSEARIMGDPLRLRQVIHNLIKNAQEALEGRPNPRILVTTELSREAETPSIELRIEDNGTGFDESLLNHLFEPYVTTKSKGTGLGLAIVKKIIEEHGGIIWAENANGGAASWPACPCGRTIQRRHSRLCGERNSMSASHILVVDDEPDIRALVQEILEDEGFLVAIAENGESARHALRDRRPDLILLDIWMPDLDGISLLKEWSEDAGLPCPVIMMSGHGTVETAVEATRLGAYDFLEKPLSMAKLLLTVERALEADKLQKENVGLRRRTAIVHEPVGRSAAMQRLREQVKRIAQHDTWVLITGEAGSGRETFARYLHAQSARRERPFVDLGVSGIARSNAARAFGSEDGDHIHYGSLEQAAGGALLLDEVADMDLEVQGQLLGAWTPALSSA